MATTPQTIAPRSAEVVVVPAELVAAFTPERLRNLHAALARAIAAGAAITLKVQPKHGRVVGLDLSVETSL